MNVLKPIFYLVLIGLLVTGSMTRKNNFLLKTNNAPLAIISLELSTTTLGQQKILKEWESIYINQQIYSRDTVVTEKLTGLATAIKQTKADYSFILFYVLFLSLLFFKYRKHLAAAQQLVSSNHWLYLSVLVFLAGILDLVENGQLLKLLHRYNTELVVGNKAIWIFLPALLKFLLLLSAVIYFLVKIKAIRLLSVWLQRLSLLLKGFLYYGWKFRIVLLGLLTLFLLMAFTEQGKDLLVTINTSDWGIFWFFTATTVLALLNWYLPKIYDNLNEVDLTKVPRRSLKFSDNDRDKLDFARFLGLLTFLIPAVGVLITMQAYHISYLASDIPPLVILVIISLLYLSALRNNWLDHIYKPHGNFNSSRYIITMVLVFGAIIYWGRSQETREPYYLAYLSLGFFLLSFAFVVTMSYRTCITAVKKIPIAPFILTAGILASLIFVAFNFDGIVFYLTRYDRFYTLPIVISALISYSLFFSFLLIIGYKTKIQFITLFLLLVIYRSATINSDFHKVHLLPKPANQPQKVDLRSYAQQWLQSRRIEIAAFNQAYDTTAYPVFFVNAYGGGIKAAAWTTMVIGRLDQLLQQNQIDSAALPNNFQHYAFSYSGVSGGAVGLSLLAAARISDESHPKIDTLFYPVNSLKIYHHDYLTATLAAFFGRDAFMALIGQNWYPDRARLQEKNWEFHIKKYRLQYATLLGDGWQFPQKNIPLFFSNTYDIKTGFKGIMAPVRLNEKDFPGSILLQGLIDKNQDLYLSTTAFVSARFPYVSPTAKFDEQHHFTDGGTLENSGAETSLQVLTVFKHVLDSLQQHDPNYRDLKININILSLPNSVPVMDSLERVKNLYEPLAPALGILNSTNGNTIKAETINRLLAEENNWNYFSVNPRVLKIKTRNVWPVLPLGWQISDYALEQMVLSVTSPNSGLQPVLQQFPMFTPKME